MSESIDLTNLPKRKQRVTLTERQLREEDLEKRIAELEQQLAEAQELWGKIKEMFSLVVFYQSGNGPQYSWDFFGKIPAKIDEPIEDAVRRLP